MATFRDRATGEGGSRNRPRRRCLRVVRKLLARTEVDVGTAGGHRAGRSRRYPDFVKEDLVTEVGHPGNMFRAGRDKHEGLDLLSTGSEVSGGERARGLDFLRSLSVVKKRRCTRGGGRRTSVRTPRGRDGNLGTLPTRPPPPSRWRPGRISAALRRKGRARAPSTPWWSSPRTRILDKGPPGLATRPCERSTIGVDPRCRCRALQGLSEVHDDVLAKEGVLEALPWACGCSGRFSGHPRPGGAVVAGRAGPLVFFLPRRGSCRLARDCHGGRDAAEWSWTRRCFRSVGLHPADLLRPVDRWWGTRGDHCRGISGRFGQLDGVVITIRTEATRDGAALLSACAIVGLDLGLSGQRCHHANIGDFGLLHVRAR